jgi:hypothetical protein
MGEVRETYIFRVEKERNYTVMDNTFLRDPNLSLKAKGLMAYLLSLPDSWKVHVSELVNHFPDGITAIRNALKDLENSGYLVMQKLKTDKGKFAGTCYQIIENPQDYRGDEDLTQLPSLEEERRCKSDFTATGNPCTGNQTLLNTNKLNTKTNSNKFEFAGNPPSPLIKPENKSSKKEKSITAMKGMIYSFTNNEAVEAELFKYFNWRVTKGLTVEQWQIILEDLRNYAGTDADVALEKIRNAIAGGYRQIIASWEKEQAQKTRATRFDNTAGHEVSKLRTASELEDELATDASGNPVYF